MPEKHPIRVHIHNVYQKNKTKETNRLNGNSWEIKVIIVTVKRTINIILQTVFQSVLPYPMLMKCLMKSMYMANSVIRFTLSCKQIETPVELGNYHN